MNQDELKQREGKEPVEAEEAESSFSEGGVGPNADEMEEKVEERFSEEDVPAETPAADHAFGEGDGEGEDGREERQEKMLPQSQVNELVGKAREEGRQKGRQEAMAELLGRYGVDSDDALDKLFVDGSRFGEEHNRYLDSSTQLEAANAELALLKAGIPEEKHNDVKAILAYSNLPINVETIKSLMPTHPEWTGQPVGQQVGAGNQGPLPMPMPQPQPVPERMGAIPQRPAPQSSQAEREKAEEEQAMKMFGYSN